MDSKQLVQQATTRPVKLADTPRLIQKKLALNSKACLFGVWARSLARIKASASEAENPGFKSQRAR